MRRMRRSRTVKIMETLKALNPVWFVRESWRFMSGTPRWRVILMMPLAYLDYAQLVILDR